MVNQSGPINENVKIFLPKKQAMCEAESLIH